MSVTVEKVGGGGCEGWKSEDVGQLMGEENKGKEVIQKKKSLPKNK
jgi:hypothetical protein